MWTRKKNRLKDELIKLFGQKPEDSYIRAKNRVMSGLPSQLGKLLVDDICTCCAVKLSGGCCAKVVWGMFREALPIVIRNHIAEMTFDSNTYQQVFDKADKIHASNQGPDPGSVRPAVAATTATSSTTAVAAVSAQRNKNQRNKPNKPPKPANQNKPQNQQKPTPKPAVNEDNLLLSNINNGHS